MGLRGPKPGFKALKEGAETPLSSAPELSAADRENPEKLTGDALRKLAHNRGMSRSDLEAMPEDKIRLQLRYLAYRQYADGDS